MANMKAGRLFTPAPLQITQSRRNCLVKSFIGSGAINRGGGGSSKALLPISGRIAWLSYLFFESFQISKGADRF